MHLRFLRLFSSYHAISSSIRKSTRCIVCPHLSFRAGLHNFKEHLELGIISRAAFRISNISSFSLPFGTFCWCIDNPSLIWSFLYYHFLTSLKNGDSERLMTLMLLDIRVINLMSSLHVYNVWLFLFCVIDGS
jgi:hypothetical protein